MKYILIVFVAFLSSCSNTQNYNNDRVSMVDKTINYPFKITDVKSALNQNGFLEVQVNGFNKNTSYKALEYRVDWLDNRGFSIYSNQNNRWFGFPVFRNQIFNFNPIAPSVKAVDFRIFIRDPNKNTYNPYNSQKGEI
jgi:uncharacterized protein YcfL